MKEFLVYAPEVIQIFSIFAPAVLGLAYTKAQRDWLQKRDNFQCQFPIKWTKEGYTPCGRTEPLEEHHIKPQRWSKDVLRLPEKKIDTPENGLTLCAPHHHVIHPDISLAKANYHKDKLSFQQCFQQRNTQIEQYKRGEVKRPKKYWNTTWDRVLSRIAKGRTRRMDTPFPEKG